MDVIDDRILAGAPARRPGQQRRARGPSRPVALGLRRVQELERSGVIRGYRAVLDRSRLGIGFTAFMAVGLGSHTKAAQEAFERGVAAAPEVVECHNVTGAIEYLLRVEVADLAAYKRFHTDVLGTLPQVSAITSYVVMGSPKNERA